MIPTISRQKYPLNILFRHGYKPIQVTTMVCEDTFIFATKEECLKAHKELAVEKELINGWWYSYDDFVPTLMKYEEENGYKITVFNVREEDFQEGGQHWTNPAYDYFHDEVVLCHANELYPIGVVNAQCRRYLIFENAEDAGYAQKLFDTDVDCVTMERFRADVAEHKRFMAEPFVIGNIDLSNTQEEIDNYNPEKNILWIK